jgi:serine/threonine protein phosphatase PrpC
MATTQQNPLDPNILLKRFTRADFEAAKRRLLERYRLWHGLLISNDEQSVITPDDVENIKLQAAEILGQEIKSEYELEQLKILTVLIYLLMHANQEVAITPDPDIQEQLEAATLPNAKHFIVRKMVHHSKEMSLDDIRKLGEYENLVLSSYTSSTAEGSDPSKFYLYALRGLASADGQYFNLCDMGYEIGIETAQAPAKLDSAIQVPSKPAAKIERLTEIELEPLILRDEKATFLINNYQDRKLSCGATVAASSYIGRDRNHNEDGIAVFPEIDKLVVIDAMGGYGNGVTARDLFIEVLQENADDLELTVTEAQMRYDEAQLDQGGVCIVGVSIWRDGENFSVDLAQAGDVHAVIFDNDGEIKFETVDESIGHLVINAIIGKNATQAQRENGWKNFGVLTKTSIRAKPGWRMAVYSDGVGNHFKATDIGDLVINKTSKQAIAAISKELDQKMQVAGAYKDNSSIAIVDF